MNEYDEYTNILFKSSDWIIDECQKLITEYKLASKKKQKSMLPALHAIRGKLAAQKRELTPFLQE